MTRISQCGQLVPTMHPIRMRSVSTDETYLVRLAIPTVAQYCVAYRTKDGRWYQVDVVGGDDVALEEEPTHVWLVETIADYEIEEHERGEVE